MVKVPTGKGGEGAAGKLAYAKDRTLTRRTVRGAAGGMLGVDYEDARRPDPSLRPRTDNGPKTSGADAKTHGFSAPSGQPHGASEARPGAAPKEEAEMILDDEDALTRDMKARQRAKHFVPRDRFTVDKDAPNRERRIRWDLLDEEDDDSESAPREAAPEFDLVALGEGIATGDDRDQARAHLFARKAKARPGDPLLSDPKDAMQLLGSPLAYAHHALLLSEAFRVCTGATRDEVIAYLGDLFLALPDWGFARSALREFGPSTGVAEIYPLELLRHLVLTRPEFLPKHRLEPVVSRAPDATVFSLEPFRALELELPVDRVVRGFALLGGGRPGYRFEPALVEGLYRLVMGSVGSFEVLIAARNPHGAVSIDQLSLEVRGDGPEAPVLETPVRDEAKLRAWPRPRNALSVPKRPRAPRSRKAPSDPKHLSTAERHARTERDRLLGPTGQPILLDFRGLHDGPEARPRSDRSLADEAAARRRAGLPDAPSEPEEWAFLHDSSSSEAPAETFTASDEAPPEEPAPKSDEAPPASPAALPLASLSAMGFAIEAPSSAPPLEAPSHEAPRRDEGVQPTRRPRGAEALPPAPSAGRPAPLDPILEAHEPETEAPLSDELDSAERSGAESAAGEAPAPSEAPPEENISELAPPELPENLEIEPEGDLDIEPEGEDLNPEPEGDLDLDPEGDLDIDAEGDLDLEPEGEDLDPEPEGDLDIEPSPPSSPRDTLEDLDPVAPADTVVCPATEEVGTEIAAALGLSDTLVVPTAEEVGTEIAAALGLSGTRIARVAEEVGTEIAAALGLSDTLMVPAVEEIGTGGQSEHEAGTEVAAALQPSPWVSPPRPPPPEPLIEVTLERWEEAADREDGESFEPSVGPPPRWRGPPRPLFDVRRWTETEPVSKSPDLVSDLLEDLVWLDDG